MAEPNNQLPTAEQAFGANPNPAPNNLPTAEQAFGKAPSNIPTSGLVADALWASHGLANNSVLNAPSRAITAFGQGFTDQWGASGQSLSDETNEALRKAGWDKEWVNSKYAVYHALSENLLRPALRDIAGSAYESWEGLQRGFQSALRGSAAAINTLTGEDVNNTTDSTLGGAIASIGEWALQRGDFPAYSSVETLARARANSVIGESEGSFMGTKEATPKEEAARVQAISELPQEKPDIHSVARQINPDLFSEYDNLTAQRNNLENQLFDITNKEPEAEGLTQSGQLAEQINKQFNQPEALEKQLQDINSRLNTLSPYVREAYNVASDYVPKEDIVSQAVDSAPVNPSYIAQSVSQKLTDLGRPQDEATAIGALIQAHYEARAARFGGRIGTAQELYDRDFPEVQLGGTLKGLFQYAGPNAVLKGADHSLLETAKYLDQQGDSQEEIRASTGWFKNKLDNKWRQEFPDNEAELKAPKKSFTENLKDLVGWPILPKTVWEEVPESKLFEKETAVPLSDILTHDKLFEKYPESKNIQIIKRSPFMDIWKNTQGWFNSEKNQIGITPYAQDPLSTLLHEVQHWIQNKEGFARGGNTSTVLSNLSTERLKELFTEAITKGRERSDNISKNIDKLQDIIKTIDLGKARQLYTEEQELWEKSRTNESLKTEWNKKYKEERDLKDSIALEHFGVKASDLDSGSKDLFYKLEDYFRKPEKGSLDNLVNDLKKDFVNVQDYLSKLNQGDLETLKEQIDPDRSFKLYQAIAGEIEARDVQARQKLTPEDRAKIEPLSSQEYDPKDVSVVYDPIKDSYSIVSSKEPINENLPINNLAEKGKLPEGYIPYEANANKEFPELTTEGQPLKYLEQGGKRGAIELREGKNLIKLFDSADISTFLHETGHQWLEELKADAQHPEAPDNLKQDYQTVLQWLKARDGQELSRAQHEKFARGFERYLREGVAPSPNLASIFAQFKAWLTKIYNTVSQLKAPINDDIRQVFDRLINIEPEKTTIAPEVAPPFEGPLRAPTEPVEGQTPEQAISTQSKVEPQPEGSKIAPGQPIEEGDKQYTNKDGTPKPEAIDNYQDAINGMKEFVQANSSWLDHRHNNITHKEIISTMEAMGQSDREGFEQAIRRLSLETDTPFASAVLAVGKMSEELIKDVKTKAEAGDIAAYLEARERALGTISTFLGGRRMIGQSMHAFQIMAKQAREADQLLEFFQNSLHINEGQIEFEMKAIKNLKTGKQVSGFLQDADRPSGGEMLLEAYRNWLISGPLTHLMYTTGNKISTLMRAVPETLASAAIGKATELIKGEPIDRVRWQEAITGLHSFIFGQIDGLKSGYEAAKIGQTVTLPSETAATTPFTGTKAIPNFKYFPLGSVIRSPGERMVAFIHSMDRTVAYQVSRDQQITRSLLNSGLDYGSPEFLRQFVAMQEHTPTDIMQTAAKEATDVALMGKGGSFLNKWAQLINWTTKLPVLGRTQPFAILDPFVKVIGNMNRQAFLERTPLGVFTDKFQSDLSGANGEIARQKALGAMSIGTAALAGYIWYSHTGTINPPPDVDYRKQAVDSKVQGDPYFVHVGNIALQADRFSVYGQLMKMASMLYYSAKLGVDSSSIEKGIELFIKSFWHNFTSEGFLSGMADSFKALDGDPSSANYVNNLISGFMPFSVGFSQMAHQYDPYQREFRTLFQTIEDKIPGASEELYPRVDLLGQPIPNKQFIGTYFEKSNQDPVWQAMKDADYYPAKIKKSINGVQLTDQQYYDYATIAGTTASLQLHGLINMQGWENLPQKIRRELMQEAMDSSRQSAAQIVMARSRNTDNDIIQKAQDTLENAYK